MEKRLLHYLSFLFILVFLNQLNGQTTEGSLVKGSGDAVYIIKNGKASWISSLDVFKLLNLDWKNVKTISDGELKKYPINPLIVKGTGKALYAIFYGVACKIPDTYILAVLGLDKCFVHNVQENMLAKIPKQPLLVKGKGAPIYLLNNNKLSWIPTEKIFLALEFDMRRVLNISDESILKIGKTPLLIKGEDEKIYLIDKEKKHWISSPSLFGILGYDWNYVHQINKIQLGRIPEGDAIK